MPGKTTVILAFTDGGSLQYSTNMPKEEIKELALQSKGEENGFINLSGVDEDGELVDHFVRPEWIKMCVIAPTPRQKTVAPVRGLGIQ